MDLEDCRRRIDEIDRKIVALLNVRAGIALEIKSAKTEENRPVFDPGREQLVYENVTKANQGPLSDDALKAIYREIIAVSRQLQQPLKVAYFGPQATFTHQAARTKFGAAAEYLAARSIGEVFTLAEKGEADFGVVPVENTTDGFVGHTFDVLANADLKICAEVVLPIQHNLISRGSRDTIQAIYSHPQALGQTGEWLAANFPDIPQVEVSSTARAAEIAAGDEHAAAIGTELAAEVYGLNVVARRIEDNPHNITRFFVVGPGMGGRTGSDKTSVMFTVKNRVGALHDILGTLLKHRIDLTRIESRPSKQKLWDYVFFIDVVGHPEDAHVDQALKQLGQECALVKVLGAWATG